MHDVRQGVPGWQGRELVALSHQVDAGMGILETAARHMQAHVGVYASVRHGGTICLGDAIRVEAGRQP